MYVSIYASQHMGIVYVLECHWSMWLLYETRISTFAASHHQALILEFTLLSSTYATMAVRELLRLDTSARHQSSLNCVTMSQLPPPAAATEVEGAGPSGSTGGLDATSSSGLDQGPNHGEPTMEGDCWDAQLLVRQLT